MNKITDKELLTSIEETFEPNMIMLDAKKIMDIAKEYAKSENNIEVSDDERNIVIPYKNYIFSLTASLGEIQRYKDLIASCNDDNQKRKYLIMQYAWENSHKFLKLIGESNTINEPIKYEGLAEAFNKVIYDEHGNLLIGNLVKKCVEIAQQYAQSKINNTIEDEWISVEKELPRIDGDSTVYCLVLDSKLGIVVRPFNEYHNCWDEEDADDFYTPAKGGNITHWQPLPQTPNK